MENKTKMQPIPDYGDLMTIKDFVAGVRSNWLTNDDGIGFFATETEYSDNFCVWDEKIERPSWATHVVWFNK